MKKLIYIIFVIGLFSIVSTVDAQVITPPQKKIEKDTVRSHKTKKEDRQGTSVVNPRLPKGTCGTLSLGYGTWEGSIKNGKPDGKGKIVFSVAHPVDRSVSYTANPGDYFIATYDGGSLISGKLYDSSGNLLKTIIP